MSLLVTAGYSYGQGAVVTPTKQNLSAAPTIAGGQTYDFGAGTAAAPAMCFTAALTTGFYLAGAALGFAVAGVSVGNWAAGGLTIGNGIIGGLGITGDTAITGNLKVTNGYKRQSATQTRNTVTLSDITDLFIDVVAGQTYVIRASISMDAGVASGGCKIGFAGTATVTALNGQCFIFGGNAGAPVAQVYRFSTLPEAMDMATMNKNFTFFAEITVVAATSGTITIQAAQSNTSGTLTIYQGNTMSSQKL